MRLLNGALDSNILERKLFFDWVLGIGDGTIGESNDVDLSLDIPSDLLISNKQVHVAFDSRWSKTLFESWFAAFTKNGWWCEWSCPHSRIS